MADTPRIRAPPFPVNAFRGVFAVISRISLLIPTGGIPLVLTFEPIVTPCKLNNTG